MRWILQSVAFSLTSLIALPALATITNLAPFTGTLHENFDEYPGDSAAQFLDLFNNQGRITIEGNANAIKLEWFSSLDGDAVVPISRLMCGQLGIADWTFNNPVTQFGGYWDNNSHADDATVQFFDANGVLFDTRVVPVSATAQHWQWNGWDFGDTPVSKIRVTGNGIINGFIWYENMEITTVPEPVAAGFLAMTLALAGMNRPRRDIPSV